MLVPIYTLRFLTDKNYTHDVLLQLRHYAPVIYCYKSDCQIAAVRLRTAREPQMSCLLQRWRRRFSHRLSRDAQFAFYFKVPIHIIILYIYIPIRRICDINNIKVFRTSPRRQNIIEIYNIYTPICPVYICYNLYNIVTSCCIQIYL